MIAPQPPHTIELLLASLGAETQFRDAIIGDMAEEFAHRAERDSLAAARSWYYREAIRATPHLLWNWVRRLTGAELLHLAGVLASTYVIVLITFGLVMMSIATVVLAISGIPLAAQQLPWGNPVLAALMFLALFVADFAVGLFGGFVAAYLNQRSPIATAIAFGTAGTLFAVVQQAMFGIPPMFRHAPVGLNLVPIAMMLIGAVVGGAWRVRVSGGAIDGDQQIA